MDTSVHNKRDLVLSVLETVVFFFILFIGASIIWSTLVLGISPMPSSKKARLAMLQLIREIDKEQADNGAIFELGSGWGNLLIPLAKTYPEREVVGYELSLMPWLASVMLKQLLGLKNLQVLRKDFLLADLTRASVLLCYLFPGGMNNIERKLNADAGEVRYLISNNFALPSHSPSKTLQIDDFYRSPVYLYRLNGKAEN